ncbi:MAG: hypothetical protein AAB874_01860 [Patescibacteria group bacterium]
MKRKDIKLLHTKTVSEITKELTDKYQALKKTELAVVLKNEKNVRKLSDILDDISRLATVLSEKQLKEKGAT